MSPRRNGLRKQVTEATEGPLELRREFDESNAPGGARKGREGRHTPEREGMPPFCLFLLK